MEEIEYIPFYGELKMTTFTSEDRKEAAKKKPKKGTIEKEIVSARTVGLAEELQSDKANTIAQVIQDLHLEEAKEWIKPESEFALTDWAALNDPSEPGMTDVASTPKGANVIRRGFTTIQMAHAFRNGLKNPEEHFIVEVREGILMDGPILAHYVIHKSQEL
jgi:hypothetical protein